MLEVINWYPKHDLSEDYVEELLKKSADDMTFEEKVDVLIAVMDPGFHELVVEKDDKVIIFYNRDSNTAEVLEDEEIQSWINGHKEMADIAEEQKKLDMDLMEMREEEEMRERATSLKKKIELLEAKKSLTDEEKMDLEEAKYALGDIQQRL